MLQVPEQEPGEELQRHDQQHDDLVHHALQRVELLVRADVVRVGVAPEDPVAVVLQLAQAAAEVLHRAQLGVVDLDLVREQVEQQPDEEVGDQHEPDPVVQVDRGAEGHQPDQVHVAQLDPGQDQRDEAERVDPVPDPDRQRMHVDPLGRRACMLRHRHLPECSRRARCFLNSHFTVMCPIGTPMPPASASRKSRSRNRLRVPPIA